MTPKSKHEYNIRFKLRKYGNEVSILRALMLFFLCRDGQEPTETLHTMLQLIRTMEWKPRTNF